MWFKFYVPTSVCAVHDCYLSWICCVPMCFVSSIAIFMHCKIHVKVKYSLFYILASLLIYRWFYSIIMFYYYFQEQVGISQYYFSYGSLIFLRCFNFAAITCKFRFIWNCLLVFLSARYLFDFFPELVYSTFVQPSYYCMQFDKACAQHAFCIVFLSYRP